MSINKFIKLFFILFFLVIITIHFEMVYTLSSWSRKKFLTMFLSNNKRKITNLKSEMSSFAMRSNPVKVKTSDNLNYITFVNTKMIQIQNKKRFITLSSKILTPYSSSTKSSATRSASQSQNKNNNNKNAEPRGLTIEESKTIMRSIYVKCHPDLFSNYANAQVKLN
jgi:hypothetical protein